MTEQLKVAHATLPEGGAGGGQARIETQYKIIGKTKILWGQRLISSSQTIINDTG